MKLEIETNPNVEWKERRKKILGCSYCPPNKVENEKRGCQFHKKHRSWKFRSKIKKQFKKEKKCPT